MRPLPGLWGVGGGQGDLGVREDGQGGVTVPGVVAANPGVVEAGLVLRRLVAPSTAQRAPATPDPLL